jgi:hypothetical protein
VLASLHAIAPGGEPIGGEVLSRLTGVSETPVVLDRFIRCLHLLNYLQGQYQDKILLLPAALLERVSQDHGRVFRQIVDQLLCHRHASALCCRCLAYGNSSRGRLQQSYARHGFETYLACRQTGERCQRLRPVLRSA